MSLARDVSTEGERGGATSVELALLWSALLLLILGVVQVTLVTYAGQLALTAAQDGLRSGRAYRVDATGLAAAETARRDAEGFLARTGGTILTGVVVAAEVDTGASLLRVRVAGTALSLVPGATLSVEREAVGPVERTTP